jgi:DNA-binding NarL/FixJ family response regulator
MGEENMEDQSRIKILVIDSKPIICKGISGILNDYPDFQVVGYAGDVEESLTCCEMKTPDVVIIDPDFPCNVSGSALIHKLKEKYSQARIIVLTNLLNDMTIREMLREGVVGYLLKTTSIDDFIHAIHTAFPGKPVLSPEVTQYLIEGMNASDKYKENLTRREHQVLELIIQGKNNVEISKELNISFSTVQFHVSNILTKLHSHNRVEAATLALRMKLLND